MKRIAILIMLFLTAVACTDSFEKLNDNPKKPTAVPAYTLLATAESSLAYLLGSPNVNDNIFRLLIQHWTETQYFTESRYNITNRNIPRILWNELYVDILQNFDAAKKIIEADLTLLPGAKTNQLAIVNILKAYTFSILVDTYGDVPYSQALDYTNITPKYDDAATIYDELFATLDASVTALNEDSASFDEGELISGGDPKSWKKFATVLKLRMGMRLADVNSAKAQSIVESAVASGNLFTSNTDNALFTFLPGFPNTGPMYTELIYQGRKDFVATETIINRMDSLSDPRIPFYFTNVLAYKTIKDTLRGAPNGALNVFASNTAPIWYAAYNDSKVLIKKNTVEAYPTTFFDYSEVEFYLAEAAERGYNVGGTAESHYNNAIEASILDWGGTSVDVTTYLANPLVAYSSASGTYKEKIGLQKWIALYSRGFEAWCEYRRLDAPSLYPVTKQQFPFPARYTYPNTEATLNPTNWTAAIAKFGGTDVVTAKVFWDKF